MTQSPDSVRVAKAILDILTEEVRRGTDEADLMVALIVPLVHISNRYHLPTPVVMELFDDTRSKMEKR